MINVSGLPVPHQIEYLALNPKVLSRFKLTTKSQNTIGWIGFWNHVFVYYGSVPVYIFCAISMYLKIKRSSKIVANRGAVEMHKKMFYLVLIQVGSLNLFLVNSLI